MLYVVCCMLYVACCMLHVVCCMLYVVCKDECSLLRLLSTYLHSANILDLFSEFFELLFSTHVWVSAFRNVTKCVNDLHSYFHFPMSCLFNDVRAPNTVLLLCCHAGVQEIGFCHMRIAEGVGSLLQLSGLLAKFCRIREASKGKG